MKRVLATVAGAVALLVPLMGPARALGPGTGVVVTDTQPDYGWDASYQSLIVRFPSHRTGASLAGTLYAPTDLDQLGKLPSVVVIPPSGGAATQGSVSFIAKYLAGRGYIGLTVDPQGVGNSDSFSDTPCQGGPGRTNPSPCPNVPFQQMDNFFDAGQSALDFLLGADNPWRQHIKPSLVGAAGHSEGARAASYLQDPTYDGRVHAVVALDNLTADWYGDDGTPSHEGPGGSTGIQNAVINGQPDGAFGASLPIKAYAPAMGIASDGGDKNKPDEKKTAFSVWRSSGVASMELVLAGVNHLQFSQSRTSNEDLIHRLAILTAEWFDLSLTRDPGAVDALGARTVLGMPVEQLLSTTFNSAMYVPDPRQPVDCATFQTACAIPPRHGQ